MNHPTTAETLATGTAVRDVFALTDEQIVGIEPGGEEVAGEESTAEATERTEKERGKSSSFKPKDPSYVRDDNYGRRHRQGATAEERSAEEGGVRRLQSSGLSSESAAVEPLEGEAARQLWDGVQRAERDAAAYREVFATPEEAWALRELYPGGLNEARLAVERARQLDEIDGAFFRGDAAARMQLAQRMMTEDPAAFQEMVAVALKVLEEAAGRATGSEEKSRSLGFVRDGANGGRAEKHGGTDGAGDAGSAQAGMAAPLEIAREYGAFERAANAELERSVGGAIARMMQEALPNLRQMRDSGKSGLQERLSAAVREEIDAGLKSDRQLGEQVAKILAGRKFDDAAREQVVRLIDARAQQLAPGAVKRVVGTWTQATLAPRGAPATRMNEGSENQTIRVGLKPSAANEWRDGAESTKRGGRSNGEVRQERRTAASRRVDYRKLTDEEILNL